MENIIDFVSIGDQKAFETLFKEYYSRLCEYSFGLSKDKDMSSEIVQDIFVTLWEKRVNLNIKAVKPYLFKAVHNNTIKYISSQKRFESIEQGNEYGAIVLNNFELTQELEKTLKLLPPKCKHIFELSRIEKQSHNEIAKKLNISPRTVEVQIRKANLILREKLKDFLIITIIIFFK